MKYKRPILYPFGTYSTAEAMCADGNNAGSTTACVSGPEAVGGCKSGAAASSRCNPGALAGTKCDNGDGFD